MTIYFDNEGPANNKIAILYSHNKNSNFLSFSHTLVLSQLSIPYRTTFSHPEIVSISLYYSPEGGEKLDLSASAQIKLCAKLH